MKEKVEEEVELMKTLGEVRELEKKFKEKQVELEERLGKWEMKMGALIFILGVFCCWGDDC